ncbi:hypothetical protein D5F01_LYC22497 [Larimichthys crocea]|uniref:Interleukin-5 receptor subunit alpha n=1 Tax=Larimichthys crocea TaxID=215358 RepID=A0A6G0HI92_LARCR|nr:hypothetical protein D5F01_LYC22497 [Larimichthys crocea]
MFQSLDLFGLSCLFLTVTCQEGNISQPQNVSLVWVGDFKVRLSWARPQDLRENCKYKVGELHRGEEATISTPSWEGRVPMERGFLQVSVRTVCDRQTSPPVFKNLTYPELVKNLECNIHTSKHTRCSWIPVSGHSPSFFYELEDGGGVNEENFLLRACPLSTHDGRTGCNLTAHNYYKIHILINETRDNETYINIFSLDFQVKPPALHWTVTNAGNEFIINWTAPDIRGGKFIINYTECSENKKIDVTEGTSYNLSRVPHCGYNMKIKAESELHKWETPWSIPYEFDADTNPNVLLAAAIVIPLLIVILAALLLVCWRKNKNIIFPKVPKPRDLLSDISDNNNKTSVSNLYVPAEEEENCKITLVVDPQNNKPDS